MRRRIVVLGFIGMFAVMACGATKLYYLRQRVTGTLGTVKLPTTALIKSVRVAFDRQETNTFTLGYVDGISGKTNDLIAASFTNAYVYQGTIGCAPGDTLVFENTKTNAVVTTVYEGN